MPLGKQKKTKAWLPEGTVLPLPPPQTLGCHRSAPMGSQTNIAAKHWHPQLLPPSSARNNIPYKTLRITRFLGEPAQPDDSRENYFLPLAGWSFPWIPWADSNHQILTWPSQHLRPGCKHSPVSKGRSTLSTAAQRDISNPNMKPQPWKHPQNIPKSTLWTRGCCLSQPGRTPQPAL